MVQFLKYLYTLFARNSFRRHGCLHGGIFLDISILKFERGHRPPCTFQKSNHLHIYLGL